MMTKKELDQAEREIQLGLSAANRVIYAVVEKLKLETPSQPLGTLETQVMYGQDDVCLAALARIKQMREALQRASTEDFAA
jgi:hypothetical protein